MFSRLKEPYSISGKVHDSDSPAIRAFESGAVLKLGPTVGSIAITGASTVILMSLLMRVDLILLLESNDSRVTS